MAEQTIVVPEPPVLVGALGQLPDSVRKQWRETYAKAYRQAQTDSPNEPTKHAQEARKAAAAVLALPKVTSYDHAMSLPDWQVMRREVNKQGQLVLVTIEARGAEKGESKYYFDVPERAPEKVKAAK